VGGAKESERDRERGVNGGQGGVTRSSVRECVCVFEREKGCTRECEFELVCVCVCACV